MSFAKDDCALDADRRGRAKMSTGPTYFTTEEADEIFMNDFVLGTSGLIQAEILKANDLYDNLP